MKGAPRVLDSHAALVRRTRWHMALQWALVATGVLALLSTGAFLAARRAIWGEMHEQLSGVADHAQGSRLPPGYSWISGSGQSGPDFQVVTPAGGTPVARLRRIRSGGIWWLSMPTGDDARVLRTFGLVLAGLTAAGWIVALPAGFVLASQALRPLEQAVRERTEFVALASHRLRTPLTVIRTSADLALAGKGMASAEALGVIREQTVQLEGLAARLTALARAEGPRWRLRPRADLLDVVRQSADALQAAAQLAGVVLQVRDGAPVPVRAQPEAVADAVVSVLENAVRFSPAGGSVVLEAEGEGPWGIVTVRDQGPGIPPDELPHVTRPFFQGRNATGGTGLGLALTQALLRRHGGRLEMRSAVGEGTTVRLLWRRLRG